MNIFTPARPFGPRPSRHRRPAPRPAAPRPAAPRPAAPRPAAPGPDAPGPDAPGPDAPRSPRARQPERHDEGQDETLLPTPASTARDDRADRRLAVHAGPHLRRRIRHPPADLRVLRLALATAIGAGVSMAFSEGLSDTGGTRRARQPVPARRHHRGRHVPRRCPAHPAVPHPPVPGRAHRGARDDRLRAGHPGLDPVALLRHRLPALVRVHRARRGDHRQRQRRARLV